MIARGRSRLFAVLLCVACFTVGLSIAPPKANAIDIGDILKGGGIALVVNQFGDQINSAINSLLGQRGIQAQGMTKVVPIIRVGSGTAVGAAQVVGPASQVRKVRAVGEVQINVAGRFRARALIPVDVGRITSGDIKGVGGVGISANIKLVL